MSTIYLTLAELIRNNKPVVLLTVIDGPNIGATLLATPNSENIGTLGDPELDRVAVRDVQPLDAAVIQRDLAPRFVDQH